MDDRRIPLARHDIRQEDIDAVVSVLRSDRLALGPRAEEFERNLADFVGVRHGVAANSGTSALHLIIRALGLAQGDEVVTTPFSFVASTNCILQEGATPIFADIDASTLCIDPAAVERAITAETRAILAVDVFGRAADWQALESIADRHGVDLIEDSAEALGTESVGRRCGAFGRAAIFGFYPNKQITTGEGGMVVTNDEALAGLCRSLGNQGRREGDGWLQHERLGYNYRMSELQAALGCAQLSRIEEIVSDRETAAKVYGEALEDINGVVVPESPAEGRMSWFVYVVRLAERFSREDRDAVLEGLRTRGIGCSDYFQPIHLQPFVRERLGTKRGDFPVTEAVGDRTIALPFFVGLAPAEIGRVADELNALIAERETR